MARVATAVYILTLSRSCWVDDEAMRGLTEEIARDIARDVIRALPAALREQLGN
jgi:hypothetical protein